MLRPDISLRTASDTSLVMYQSTSASTEELVKSALEVTLPGEVEGQDPKHVEEPHETPGDPLEVQGAGTSHVESVEPRAPKSSKEAQAEITEGQEESTDVGGTSKQAVSASERGGNEQGRSRDEVVKIVPLEFHRQDAEKEQSPGEGTSSEQEARSRSRSLSNPPSGSSSGPGMWDHLLVTSSLHVVEKL